jgi:Bacterial Ig-like domain (group 3)
VNGVATITVTMVNVGTDSITASTPADTNNNAATSPATSVTVTKMTPSLPPPTVSTTTPTPDTPVTITEQVPPGVTEPVTFYDGPTAIGTAPVVNGVATITVPSLPLGPNPITAATPGGNTSNAATSPVTPVVVSKTIPTVTLTSSANPADFNQSVTFTATIPAAASGTVTFRDGAVVLGTGAINSAGIAILTTSNLAIGSHTITASYGGNSTYDVATSAPLAEVIGKIPTAVTLTQSAASQLLHNTVTFAATVTAASPTPTGTVTFLEGTTVLGITALDTNGTVVALAKSAGAAYATSALATGSHQIVAVYSGDASFAASTSAPVTYIVQDFTNAVNGTANQNVFPGDKTSYKFDLAPLGANTFLSDLNLTVTGLPPGTTYTFTPATITAGSGTTSVVLDITTSNSLSAQNRMPKGDPMSQRGLPIALGMLGLFGLGVVRKHGRRMPRMLVVFLLLLGSLLPVAGLSGCAGGYFTLTPTTYSVSVTGTEGSIQHTATATLVVQ